MPFSSNNRRGQIAIILIIVIAVGLILYAVVFNFNFVSQGKTATMIAADSAAAYMASMVASYGESLFQENLGGRLKICVTTGFWGFLIIIVFLVAVIVTAFFCPPCAAALGTTATTVIVAATVALTMTVAAMAIQMTVIQGAVDEIWQQMLSRSLSLEDQVIENGVLTALRTAVTDPVLLPDWFDLDQDGIFGDLNNVNDPDSAPDYVSRFAYLYTRRLQGIPAGDTTVIEGFVNALEDFAFNFSDDNWALVDRLDCGNYGTYDSVTDPYDPTTDHLCCPADPGNEPLFPAVCDPCCVPEFVQDSEGNIVLDGNGDPIPLRPACCSQSPPCGNPATCLARTPYLVNDGDPLNDFPFVSQKFYEDKRNLQISFLEQLGVDDEHHLFGASSADPNPETGPTSQQYQLRGTGFFEQDASGFYGTDDRQGVFTFFHKLRDWGVALPADYSSVTPEDSLCHLCDGSFVTCTDLPGAIAPQLVLPEPTQINGPSGGPCVDGVNTGSLGDLPQVPDAVPTITSILANDSVCASGSFASTLGWKPGADRFCTSDPTKIWPYATRCPKHGTTCTETDPLTGTTMVRDCECGEAGALDASYFPEDSMDEIVYAMEEFLNDAEFLIQLKKSNLSALGKGFSDWYLDAADWIEPPCPGCPVEGCPESNPLCCVCPGSFTKQRRADPTGLTSGGGILWRWREYLEFYRDRIQQWILDPALGPGDDAYVGGSCSDPADAVWCVPPSQVSANEYGINECQGVNAGEAATFDDNNNGIRGDIEDVIACLDWNVKDEFVGVDANGLPVTVQGNAEKFQLCADACGDINCQTLPRSLVPGFYSATNYPYVLANDDQARFHTCLVSSSIVACEAACDPSALPSGDWNGNFGGTIPPTDPRRSWTDPSSLPSWPAIQNLYNTVLPGCQADPTASFPNVCQDGTGIVCSSPTLMDDLRRCSCTYAVGSCGGFCQNWGHPLDSNGVPHDSDYFNTVAEAARNTPSTSPSCQDTPAPDEFIDMVQQSVAPAKNQVAKFQKRRDLLDNVLNDANRVVPILDDAISHFTSFLDNGTPFEMAVDSPSEELIEARMNDEDTVSPRTTSFAIYVWQDPPRTEFRLDEDGNETLQGYWHAVKVDVRSPKRCNYACGPGGSAGPPDWPKIKTEKSSGFLSTTRCWFMDPATTRGVAKARVIRFDENKSPRAMVFPNGQPIWRTRQSYPGRPGRPNPSNIRAVCNTLIDPLLRQNDPLQQPWRNAFMLNELPNLDALSNPLFNGTPERAYAACWKFLHEEILKFGVQSTACVEYFLSESGSPGFNDKAGFRMKFIPCDNGFLQGNN